MAADLSLLVPELRDKAERILARVKEEGHELRPFFTTRGTAEQCRLWRQSRSTEEIYEAIDMLRREGATRLAHMLEHVGPQHGKWATNALPGQSWHQWGEAIDCFVVESGRAVWATRLRDNGRDAGPQPGYLAYAEIARDEGCDAGYFWKKQDAVHVQLRAVSVRSLHTWIDIEEEMFKRYPSG